METDLLERLNGSNSYEKELGYGYQQFMTVVFNHNEDLGSKTGCTIIYGTHVKQIPNGDKASFHNLNKYNTSVRRYSVLTYIRGECPNEDDSYNYYKVSINQHKGSESIIVKKVKADEILAFMEVLKD